MSIKLISLKAGLLLLSLILGYSCNLDKQVPITPLYLLELNNTNLLVTEVANQLTEPWEILWGPDAHIWFTEHRGFISRMDPTTGYWKRLTSIPKLHYERTSGVLGMVLHPDFEDEPYVYVHYTIDNPTPDDPERITSEVTRYTYVAQSDTLIQPKKILADIPGQPWHNGSRLLLTPDHKLILATGDIGDDEGSQDPNTLTGKMLRMNLDGSIPEDNPIKGSYVYSIGHRNTQGLVYANNRIYNSEHGPNNDDEINIVQPSQNYGWPEVEGYCNTQHELEFCAGTSVIEPLTTWTPTIAPSGLDYYDHPSIPEWNNSLLLASLKGRSLRVLTLSADGNQITQEEIYFQQLLGRIRDVCVSPEGNIYISTSNTDWHPNLQGWMYEGLPKAGDDRIIRISAVIPPSLDLATIPRIQADTTPIPLFNEDYEYMANSEDLGTSLYVRHCATCHLPGGNGVPDAIPPLVNSEWVTDDKARLIQLTLEGLSGKIQVAGTTYNAIMPGYAVLLTDPEITAILNFIRTEFNEETELISVEEVRQIRAGKTF